MGRKADEEKLENLYDTVEEYPGEKPGFFARLLGWHRSDVTRSLPGMEDRGLFLSEDDEGGLWPFKKK